MAGGMEFYWYPEADLHPPHIMAIYFNIYMLRHILHKANFWFWYLSSLKFRYFYKVYNVLLVFWRAMHTTHQGGTSSHTNITNRNQWTHPWSVNISHFLAPGSLKSFWVLLTLGHNKVVSRCRWWKNMKNTSICLGACLPCQEFGPDLTMLWFDWIELPPISWKGAEIWHSLLFGKDVGSVFSSAVLFWEGNQLGELKSWWHWTPRDPPWRTFASHDAWLDDVRWLDSRCNAPRLHSFLILSGCTPTMMNRSFWHTPKVVFSL